MSLLNRLERIFGGFAIRNISLWLVVGQVFFWSVSFLGFFDLSRIVMLPAAVLAGEWWRAIMFVFLPPATSPVLWTATVRTADVVALPDASRATAVSACGPSGVFVVSQVTEYGDVVSGSPSGCPSSWNWTLATALLSLAVALTGTVPLTEASFAGALSATVGAVVSPATVTFTRAEIGLRLPAASTARTTYW